MTLTYIYIILFLLLMIVLLVWMVSGCKHVARGVCEIKKIKDDIQSKRKKERKQKILSFMKEKKKVSNKDLRKELKVTNRTVVNYCDELEKAGKIKQVGKTGKHTHYKLK